MRKIVIEKLPSAFLLFQTKRTVETRSKGVFSFRAKRNLLDTRFHSFLLPFPGLPWLQQDNLGPDLDPSFYHRPSSTEHKNSLSNGQKSIR